VDERKAQADHHRHAKDDEDAPAECLAKRAEGIRQMVQLTVPMMRPCSPRDREVGVRQVINGDLEGRHR